MFNRKKHEELTIMQQVKKDYEIKSKRMDPRIKQHIKLTLIGFSFSLFTFFLIITLPRDIYEENEKRHEKTLTYNEIIKKMNENNFKFDAKNNPEGYLLIEDNITYLIKKFYKENYLETDLNIYAYTNYYDRTGIVINKVNENYKVYFYSSNTSIYCDKEGNSEQETTEFKNNKNLILKTIQKLEELTDNIFGGSSNEKK